MHMANPSPVVSTPKMLQSDPQLGSKSDILLEGGRHLWGSIFTFLYPPSSFQSHLISHLSDDYRLPPSHLAFPFMWPITAKMVHSPSRQCFQDRVAGPAGVAYRGISSLVVGLYFTLSH